MRHSHQSDSFATAALVSASPSSTAATVREDQRTQDVKATLHWCLFLDIGTCLLFLSSCMLAQARKYALPPPVKVPCRGRETSDSIGCLECSIGKLLFRSWTACTLTALRGTGGPICGSCAREYGRVSRTECQKCGNT